MPDRWYRGEVVFKDTLWKIDTATGNATAIATLELDRDTIDVMSISVSADDKAFGFINKTDLTPWMLIIR
jgi:hypothetical protein